MKKTQNKNKMKNRVNIHQCLLAPRNAQGKGLRHLLGTWKWRAAENKLNAFQRATA